MEENKEPTPQVQEPVKQEVKQEKPKRPSIFSRLKDKLIQYRRTMEIARKPDREEFVSSAKITGVGIALLGFIGFVIFLAYFIIIP